MSSDVLFTPATDTTGWRINGDRLWASLMDLAQIGATPKGGCRRLTLTDLDRQGRDKVIGWAREAGMSVTIDKSAMCLCAGKAATPACRPSSPAAILTPSPPAANLTATTACWRHWRWCARSTICRLIPTRRLRWCSGPTKRGRALYR